MCSVAPPWYVSLRGRPPPRPRAGPRAGCQDHDSERRELEAQIAAAVAAKARVTAKIAVVEGMVTTLTAHMHEAALQHRRVAAYHARVMDRLTEEAVAASLTGDFTQSRRTMAHLDRVSDRLRTLDGRVAEDMASLGKANFVLLERALKLDELDRELAACYGRRVRLPPSGKYVCSRRGESRVGECP
jgi:uncharacterized membrane protein